MRSFDAAAVRAALPFPVVVETLRAMFASGCHVPLRHTHQAPGFTKGRAFEHRPAVLWIVVGDPLHNPR